MRTSSHCVAVLVVIIASLLAFRPTVASATTATVTVSNNPTSRATPIWYMNNNVRVGGAAGPTIPAGWNLIEP
jgi:hypothetical protein